LFFSIVDDYKAENICILTKNILTPVHCTEMTQNDGNSFDFNYIDQLLIEIIARQLSVFCCCAAIRNFKNN